MNEEERGFTIKDKRRIFKQEEKEEKGPEAQTKPEEAQTKPEEAQTKPEEAQTEVPLPEVNFSTFILSLSSSVLMHLGEIPDPISKEKKKDLSLAKHTIDVMGMLQEKTEGNLTDNEKKLMDGILYDLRMRYVQQVGKPR